VGGGGGDKKKEKERLDVFDMGKYRSQSPFLSKKSEGGPLADSHREI